MRRENMSSKVKMGGFMCGSPASTAVCMPDDMRSVIVPRRLSSGSNRRENLLAMCDQRNVKYSRLVEPEKMLLIAKANSNATRENNYFPLGERKRDHHHHHHHHHHNHYNQQQPPMCNQQIKPRASTNVFQVVVLRVSLHCQGCAGKVKKHLSRMEGVTSFSIDLEAKRVTVMGHVSPVGVLESVSKIKRAEFWPC